MDITTSSMAGPGPGPAPTLPQLPLLSSAGLRATSQEPKPRNDKHRHQSRTLIARTSCASVDASERNDVQARAPDRLTDGEVRTPRQELLSVPTSREPGLVWKMPGECRKDRCFHGRIIQRGEDKDLATTFSATDGLSNPDFRRI